jgi:hypothetical protein
MFEGRALLIATMHEKEKALAPVFEKELGVKCVVPEKLNTDKLGTFSGEVERMNDPVTTARNKCLMAMRESDSDLVIASEGSLGFHPEIFFLPANEELLLFIDKKNNLEIIVRELSTETNFNAREVFSVEELLSFAEKVGFPAHGLILKSQKDDFLEIVKGITEKERLISAFEKIVSKHGQAYVETDMRAMYNPTRMKVIEMAAIKLIKKIKSICPECQTPGFGITNATPGLPCELCNHPTRSTLNYIYKCQKCSFEQEEKFPNGKMKEEPTYCDMCNP